MKCKAILWDVDGTLVNSEKLHYTCLQQYCQENNIPFFLKEYVTRGMSLSDIYDVANIHIYFNDKEAWVNSINQRYVEMISPSILRKGILQLVKTLNINEYLQCCVSNGETDVVNANLRKTGLSPYMKFWLSRDDIRHPKPHPEIYLRACKILNIHPSQAIAVEDSHIGIQSAKSAGIFTIAIVDIKDTIEKFSLADAIVKNTAGIEHNILSSTSKEKYQENI